MKAVCRSIKAYWLYLILIGEKTIEVGKDFPKADDWNKEVFLYCSKDKKSFNRIPQKDREWMRKYLGKVACRFVCDWIVNSPLWRLRGNTGFLAPRTEKEACLPHNACLTLDELKAYVGSETKCVCGWHISDLVIYDKPRELREFCLPCDHKNDCCTCKRAKYRVDTINSEYMIRYCGLEDGFKRPPQSWCYVEVEE